jgi:hypothetical protein
MILSIKQHAKVKSSICLMKLKDDELSTLALLMVENGHCKL